MKLIYRISLRLLLVLLPLIALWAALFYFAMVDEINDETDDALEDYSELIITRMLAGQPLPQLNEGSNNSYTITPVDQEYAQSHPHIEYYDAEVYIPEKKETEPARILATIFEDEKGLYYTLKVATPTFERDDLQTTILGWALFLYVILLVTVAGVAVWVFYKSMHPLYALLNWLDRYRPGRKGEPVPNSTDIAEFRKLNMAVQSAIDRSQELHERQTDFIGNASHELQTPLAVIGTRLEWLLDSTEPSKVQIDELLKMQRTLGHIVRLNKTLLLLTKIDNRQFPESANVDIVATVHEQLSLYEEIYAMRSITCAVELPDSFVVQMNESLASTLVSNLLKNAYVHTPEQGRIEVTITGRTLTISNLGAASLDSEHIFERFYQGAKKEGSTGLGLALVSAVGRYYGLEVDYQYEAGQHRFSVRWP